MLQSTISWIDFSAEERRRMIEVVHLFRERDTLDELGLGTVRDALADRLFPGTSTIQTRARYFLFIPWLYRSYERRGRVGGDLMSRLRKDEVRLIKGLKDSGEQVGVIGARAGASLQRFPSSIYWAGLAAWGIRLQSGSQARYHRVSAKRAQRRARARTDTGEPLGGWTEGAWHSGLPEAAPGFPREAEFALTREEAQYLCQRLLISCPKSLLTALADSPSFEQTAYCWESAVMALVNAEHLTWLNHAHNFSLCMHGASLLYNLMLAERCQRNDAEALAQVYRQSLRDWAARMVERERALCGWDRGAFWRLVEEVRPVPLRSKRYIVSWLDLVLRSVRPSALADDPRARSLVEGRERALKGARSRFASRRHLEMWSGSSGAAQLDYRWAIAQRLIRDIHQGLYGESNARA